jgi:Tfp pilus assembly protein PilX
MMAKPVFRQTGARRSQRGVVLFIALIVLVAMTLAGIGMMRSVDTNNLIAGNLAFRNAATSAADAGLESARNWLTMQSSGFLNSDQGGSYFANWQETFNPKTYDWTNAGVNVGTDAYGNTIYYVIHRMCRESGKSVVATDCFKLTSKATGESKGQSGYEGTIPPATALPYFRITAKVVGPRNTVSYIQSFMY